MLYKRLTTALIVTLALFTTSCRSSKTVTQQSHNEVVHDTVKNAVVLTIHDTIRETTTITIQTNSDGYTTKVTTNRDCEKITDRDRTAIQDRRSTATLTSSKESSTTTTGAPIKRLNLIKHKPAIKLFLIASLASFLFGLLLIPLIRILVLKRLR